MDFGSIFTNSANGSINLRPMETAPRTVTSYSGNSSGRFWKPNRWKPRLRSPRTLLPVGQVTDRLPKLTVSRLAVPSPIAMACMSYCSTNFCNFRCACTYSLRPEGGGYIASLCNKFPWASKQTTLHPVRNRANPTRFCPKGGAKKQ